MYYERLREDLMDYYGTAMYSGSPMAMMELIDVDSATNSELLKLAKDAWFDLDDYRESEDW